MIVARDYVVANIILSIHFIQMFIASSIFSPESSGCSSSECIDLELSKAYFPYNVMVMLNIIGAFALTFNYSCDVRIT